MRDKNQTSTLNEVEIGLTQALFKDNEELLYAVRKVLLQGELSLQERLLIRNAINPNTWAVIKKFVRPDFDPDAPIGQLTHALLALGNDLKAVVDIDEAWVKIQIKRIETEYFDQQLELLKDLENAPAPKIVLAKMAEKLNVKKGDREEAFITISAYNQIIVRAEGYISYMKSVAERGVLTPAQIEEMKQKNSNK